ncbi:CRISPR-associated endonuclease Cas1 [Pseudanabaena sp. UWO310]|uniref:CRISPR-associated endonuclease Cas1 n=1 Tax=Pseudanabaena sp. UWO310 TaxID=2480795 RepID=UPI00116032CF|nr:CRISPR-associated endonuclease Cas1 [Pseudanabaena sp. UWO310]TYQ24958.1 CRISPR-associated endonuclease Cas1 [Pseudanabaena sp. UWO310]
MTAIYLTEAGTVVSFKNQSLLITRKGDTRSFRLAEVSLIVVHAGVQLTSVVIAELLDRGLETIFMRQDGQFRGRLQGCFHTNPSIRLAQYQVVDSTFGMAIAQRLIEGKIRNQRGILQRWNRASKGQIGEIAEAIDLLSTYIMQVNNRSVPYDRDALMGLEGICARTYYQALRHYFPSEWKFSGRNRQPPLDPINALLSWGYGVLLARVFSAAVVVGLDPYLGFFHVTQPYRPNLVLDLMEEFRPVVVDAIAIAIIQSQVLDPSDFEPSPDGEGIWLGTMAKKLFLTQLERHFNTAFVYPPQNRNLRLSQILVEQARSLARCFVERSLDYQPYVIK